MLDYLQNPPLKMELMKGLMDTKVPNYFSLTPNIPSKIKQDKQNLNNVFRMKNIRPFSFSFENFYCLLMSLLREFKVAIVLSSHKMLYQASLSFESGAFIPLIPDFKSGKICVQEAIKQGADCFVIPFLNEDILTSNAELDEILADYFSVWDISYALALHLPLPKHANIYLANGENIGLMRPFGVMAAKDHEFYGLSSIYLEIEKIYEVFLAAIKTQKMSARDNSISFFECLRDF
ncbi:MAG: nitrogen fixation protein NifS, partial [Helicobacter sp.]|nr:nitrogen fixation protein NifS [Helicobacter sp.]